MGKEWDSGWNLSAAAKAASDVPDSRSIEEAVVAAVDERFEQLVELVAGLAEQLEGVAVRLAELEEAGAEQAEKRKVVKGEDRDVLGRRITPERHGATRRVAKSKPAESAFSRD